MSKMADENPPFTVIALDVKSLNTSVKGRD